MAGASEVEVLVAGVMAVEKVAVAMGVVEKEGVKEEGAKEEEV